MPLITRLFIDRYTMRAQPQHFFIFGDNLTRQGLGGQAKEMRGEPNGIGLITKRRPSNAPSAFLSDSDLQWLPRENNTALFILRRHCQQGLTVVWPEAGIGTGLADLANHAPKILVYYNQLKLELESI